MKAPKKTALVGWLFSEDLSAVVYYPPERLQWPAAEARPRGAADCPAIADLGRHYYVIRSPVTLSLRCTRFVPGAEFYYDVPAVDGGDKVIAGKALQRVLTVMPPAIWENPQFPTLQLNLPYVFVSDESVYVEQTPAFFSPVSSQWPLMLYGGRFPIDLWPRQLNFSFQWIDLSRPILIRRGDPLFYVRFFPSQRDRKVHLVEAERTRELENFMAAVRDVTAMVSRSFSLFPRAAELRPKRLVVPRQPYGSGKQGKPAVDYPDPQPEPVDRKPDEAPPEDAASPDQGQVAPAAKAEP